MLLGGDLLDVFVVVALVDSLGVTMLRSVVPVPVVPVVSDVALPSLVVVAFDCTDLDLVFVGIFAVYS